MKDDRAGSSRSRSEDEKEVRLLSIEDIKDKKIRKGCLLPLQTLKGLAQLAAHHLSQETNYTNRDTPLKRPMSLSMAMASSTTHNNKKHKPDEGGNGHQKLLFSAIKSADKSRVACYRSMITQEQSTFVVNNPSSGTNATVLIKKEHATCEIKKERKEKTYETRPNRKEMSRNERSEKRDKFPDMPEFKERGIEIKKERKEQTSMTRPKRKEKSRTVRAEKREKFPGIPERVEKMIKELEGSNIRLVIQKTLKNTDTTTNHNRLSVPVLRLIEEFLTEEEMEKVAKKKTGKNKDDVYISVKLIDPELKMHDLNFTRWNMKKPNGQASSVYVLNGKWRTVVEDNQFKAGDVVQLWSFRQHSTLCFALVLLSRSSNQQPNSTTQGTSTTNATNATNQQPNSTTDATTTTDASNENNSATESKQDDSP